MPLREIEALRQRIIDLGNGISDDLSKRIKDICVECPYRVKYNDIASRLDKLERDMNDIHLK